MWIVVAVTIFIVVIVSVCSIYFFGTVWILTSTERFSDFGYSAALWDGNFASERVYNLLPNPIILFLIVYPYVLSLIDTRLILIVLLLVVRVAIRRRRVCL